MIVTRGMQVSAVVGCSAGALTMGAAIHDIDVSGPGGGRMDRANAAFLAPLPLAAVGGVLMVRVGAARNRAIGSSAALAGAGLVGGAAGIVAGYAGTNLLFDTSGRLRPLDIPENARTRLDRAERGLYDE